MGAGHTALYSIGPQKKKKSDIVSLQIYFGEHDHEIKRHVNRPHDIVNNCCVNLIVNITIIIVVIIVAINIIITTIMFMMIVIITLTVTVVRWNYLLSLL